MEDINIEIIENFLTDYLKTNIADIFGIEKIIIAPKFDRTDEQMLVISTASSKEADFDSIRLVSDIFVRLSLFNEDLFTYKNFAFDFMKDFISKFKASCISNNICMFGAFIEDDISAEVNGDFFDMSFTISILI